ncbi:hypothetical protein [Streptomyces sp. SID3343]|uniref:hypothetical protein n=1 Tax=Streptomyces sp. SID3343 TaxID=2690260 RepID=UPI00136D2D45|nr:hypothetical protein [Streptomyces sp. SID3343]MYW01264.1 hypothetical protein [Streptomyces sp. SID3343]
MATALTELSDTFDNDAKKFSGGSIPATYGTIPGKDIGSIATPLVSFYTAWSSPMHKAVDGLRALSKLLGYVADAAEGWDDSVAAQYAAGPGRSPYQEWKGKKAAWDEWLKTHPDGKPKEGETAPENPGTEPPLHYTKTDEYGVETDVVIKIDAAGNVTEQTVTITDHGTNYTEHTTYGENGAYHTTTTGRDGSVSTENVQVDASGKGTKTVVTKDGTTVYTISNIKDENATWVEVPKPDPPYRPPPGGGGGHQLK